MRKLSDEEKEFTKKLVNLSQSTPNVFFGNIVDNELIKTDIFLDYQRKKIEYRFDKNIYDANPTEFIEFARSFSWKMVRYFQLLEYFQKMDLLFLYRESPQTASGRFGRLPVGNSFISSEIHDENAVGLILNHATKTIIVNPSLIDYVRNNYRTEDDIRYENSINLSKDNLNSANRAINVARNTLIVTVIIALITTAINIWLGFRAK